MSRNHAVPPTPVLADAPRPSAAPTRNEQIAARRVWEAITPLQQQMLLSVLTALGRSLVRGALPHDVRSEEASDERP